MKLRTALVVALGWSFAIAPLAGAEGLAIRVGRLIDGLGGPPISPAVILIELSTPAQRGRVCGWATLMSFARTSKLRAS